jgi:hypothetical protein
VNVPIRCTHRKGIAKWVALLSPIVPIRCRGRIYTNYDPTNQTHSFYNFAPVPTILLLYPLKKRPNVQDLVRRRRNSGFFKLRRTKSWGVAKAKVVHHRHHDDGCGALTCFVPLPEVEKGHAAQNTSIIN